MAFTPSAKAAAGPRSPHAERGAAPPGLAPPRRAPFTARGAPFTARGAPSPDLSAWGVTGPGPGSGRG